MSNVHNINDKIVKVRSERLDVAYQNIASSSDANEAIAIRDTISPRDVAATLSFLDPEATSIVIAWKERLVFEIDAILARDIHNLSRKQAEVDAAIVFDTFTSCGPPIVALLGHGVDGNVVPHTFVPIPTAASSPSATNVVPAGVGDGAGEPGIIVVMDVVLPPPPHAANAAASAHAPRPSRKRRTIIRFLRSFARPRVADRRIRFRVCRAHRAVRRRSRV